MLSIIQLSACNCFSLSFQLVLLLGQFYSALIGEQFFCYMRLQKRKKHTQSTQNLQFSNTQSPNQITLQTSPKIKFNFSENSLRCFIRDSASTRKKIQSFASQPRLNLRYECLARQKIEQEEKPNQINISDKEVCRSYETSNETPTNNLTLPSSNYFSKSRFSQSFQKTLSTTENYSSVSANTRTSEPRRQGSSPDMMQELNQILHQIENKGIDCTWEMGQIGQIEESRSEINENDEEDKLMETFSHSSHSMDPIPTIEQTDLEPYLSYCSYYNYSFPYGQEGNSSFYEAEGYEGDVQEYNKAEYSYDIDVTAIGWDARTTLMIKNIPNKYNIEELAEQIDGQFKDSYDFLYLPCDIKNNCNMGYGFINFVDASHIPKFYRSYQRRRWLKFKSTKICKLSYARLQGLSKLIEHFQNTKVLSHKDKRYQPIIRGPPL